MRHTKLFTGFPHDRMLNEKLCATCTSFSLLEVGNRSLSSHYFPWFTIAGGGQDCCGLDVGTSLRICIYTIWLSGLLDLDIYFPLKVMFDYTLIKNRKPTELTEPDWSCPVVSMGFCVMKCEGQKMKNHQWGASAGRPCKNLLLRYKKGGAGREKAIKKDNKVIWQHSNQVKMAFQTGWSFLKIPFILAYKMSWPPAMEAKSTADKSMNQVI